MRQRTAGVGYPPLLTMHRGRRVLVVSGQPQRRQELHAWLAADGYDVELAASFPIARSSIDARKPDLLVSDVKLEAYNGLHLAIWTRGRQLPTQTVLIGDPDLVLQKEAERERAVYLTPPLDEQVFLSLVSDVLEAHRSRRSPRKRVALDAVVDGVLASVVDLSYEGVCIALPDADAVALPQYFTLQVPTYDVACRVQRVWTGRPVSTRHMLLCGASLPATDGEAASMWRRLVDTVPTSSLATG